GDGPAEHGRPEVGIEVGDGRRPSGVERLENIGTRLPGTEFREFPSTCQGVCTALHRPPVPAVTRFPPELSSRPHSVPPWNCFPDPSDYPPNPRNTFAARRVYLYKSTSHRVFAPARASH